MVLSHLFSQFVKGPFFLNYLPGDCWIVIGQGPEGFLANGNDFVIK